MELKIVNIRRQPEYKDLAIDYLAEKWGMKVIYEDSVNTCLTAQNPLPVWYLLMDAEKVIGSVGLITNDFISRMDLWPWLCALYIEEDYRGQNLAAKLIEQLRIDCAEMGFQTFYLATGHEGFYEKHGFKYIADGHHPWGETSRIYEMKV